MLGAEPLCLGLRVDLTTDQAALYRWQRIGSAGPLPATDR